MNITLSLPEKYIEYLRRLKADEKLSMSMIIRLAIDLYKKEKAKKK
jgi:hypothetical protein